MGLKFQEGLTNDSYTGTTQPHSGVLSGGGTGTTIERCLQQGSIQGDFSLSSPTREFPTGIPESLLLV